MLHIIYIYITYNFIICILYYIYIILYIYIYTVYTYIYILIYIYSTYMVALTVRLWEAFQRRTLWFRIPTLLSRREPCQLQELLEKPCKRLSLSRLKMWMQEILRSLGQGGYTEPAAKRQKLTLEEQCERLVTKLEQGFEVSQTALVAAPEVGTGCQHASDSVWV